MQDDNVQDSILFTQRLICSRLFRCSYRARAFVTVNLLIERFEMYVYYYYYYY